MIWKILATALFTAFLITTYGAAGAAQIFAVGFLCFVLGQLLYDILNP